MVPEHLQEGLNASRVVHLGEDQGLHPEQPEKCLTPLHPPTLDQHAAATGEPLDLCCSLAEVSQLRVARRLKQILQSLKTLRPLDDVPDPGRDTEVGEASVSEMSSPTTQDSFSRTTWRSVPAGASCSSTTCAGDPSGGVSRQTRVDALTRPASSRPRFRFSSGERQSCRTFDRIRWDTSRRFVFTDAHAE